MNYYRLLSIIKQRTNGRQSAVRYGTTIVCIYRANFVLAVCVCHVLVTFPRMTAIIMLFSIYLTPHDELLLSVTITTY